MNRKDFEAMGDRHKAFETRETSEAFMPGLPVIARLDGRAFHTFTRGLQRPYDENLREAFIETTRYLVDTFQASAGYCQSDEITLSWPCQDPNKPLLFDGRKQKLVSTLAATASVKFFEQVCKRLPHKAHLLPTLDCRAYQYPTLELATEAFLWREADATRNSLTMAAHAHYSHKELHKAGYAKKHELLFAKGINWNDYPAAFKRGVYVRRETVLKELSPQELSRIPEKHRPSGPVQRTVVQVLNLPPLSKVLNATGVLMLGEQPRTANDSNAEEVFED